MKRKRVVDFGTWNITKRVQDWGVGARYTRLRDHLEAMFGMHPGIDLIGFEDVMPFTHQRIEELRLYNGFVAALHVFNEEAHRPVEGVNPSTLKKIATGNGRADKDEVVAAATKKWDREISIHDEADAMWAGFIAGQQAGLWK